MSGVRCQVLGVRCLVSGVRCQVSGVWCHVSGVRREVSGVRCQVSGVTFCVVFVLDKAVEQSGVFLKNLLHFGQCPKTALTPSPSPPPPIFDTCGVM